MSGRRASNQVQRANALEENESRDRAHHQQLSNYLTNSLFNFGLPRPAGRNICYINSLFVALRCLYNLFTLMVDSRIYAYFSEFWNEQDPLWNFSALLTDMCKDVSRTSKTTEKRRDKFIDVLLGRTNGLNYRSVDMNPLPQGNAQGDPMELLLFLKDLFLQSIEAMREKRASLLSSSRRPTRQHLRKVDICDKALEVGEQLERMLSNDLMPTISDWNLCPDDHAVKIATKTFFSVPIAREYSSVRNILLDFFGKKQFKKRCEDCGNAEVLARSGFRLDEMPEKLFVIGLAYNGEVNTRTGQVEQIGINWVPEIEEYLNLDEFFDANEDIYGRRINKLHESYDYRLKSLIIRHGRNVNNSHYTTLCRNLQSNNWQWFNDDRVVEVDVGIRDFLTKGEQEGYPVCLFYERSTTTATETETATATTNDQISRVISKEFSNMSIQNAANDQFEQIDWEDVYNMNENNNETIAANETITNENVEEEETSIFVESTIDGDEEEASAGEDRLNDEEENSDETTVSKTISEVSSQINQTSRPGSKKRRKEKQSWKARKQKKAEAMRRLRENPAYREKEKRQIQERHAGKEREALLEKHRQTMAERRNNEELNRAEMGKNKEVNSLRRQDEEYRQKERQRDMVNHRNMREEEEYRERGRERDTQRHQDRRQDETLRQEEQSRNTLDHSVRREDEEYRERERERDMLGHRTIRGDEEYRERERERDMVSHRTMREDEEYRERERERDMVGHRTMREDEEYREREHERDMVGHRTMREDEEYRQEERERDAEDRRNRRLDEDYRQRERDADRFRRAEANNTERAIVERYNEGIKEGTDYVCVSCGGLFFKRTVTEFNQNDFRMNLGQVSISTIISSLTQVQIRTDDKLWICITCSEYVRLRQEIPTLCLVNNLKLSDVHDSIRALNDTEERLCSPRIAFIRIMPLKWDRQKGLRGNVVNVPVDVMDTVKVLPRAFSATETIQVNFMRRLNYNQAYLSDQVKPSRVIQALQELAQSDLFQKLGIEIDLDYIRNHPSNQEHLDYIVQPNEIERVEINDDNDTDLGAIHKAQTLYDDDDDEDDDRDNNQQMLPTMLLNDDERAGNEVAIRIAPGQHAMPISYMHDEYAEEATFLKIFGGHLMIDKINQRVTLQGRCKSFFRNYDRRCATNIQYIFYMYRKLMCQKLLSAINICLKKSSVRQLNITAQEALNSRSLIDKMNDDDYQRFMSSIRSSPEYWSTKKREMFAMIRQLGCPVFFITFSPAEIDWPELIILLHKLYEPDEAKKNITVEDVDRMSRQAKIDLVSKDPVTTARYFENRIRHLIKYMFHQEGPFKEDPIVDYFWRVEFQARGSPHVHMLVWMKNRPTYVVGTPLNSPENEAIVDLIDKYITCESPVSSVRTSTSTWSDTNVNDGQTSQQHEEQINAEEDEYIDLARLIKYQVHVHKSNCLVENWPSRINTHGDRQDGDVDDNNQNADDEADEGLHKFCKYGYPWPMLDRTLILDPLVDPRGKVFASSMQNSVELIEMVDLARSNFFRIKRELDRMAREQARCRKTKTTYRSTTLGELLDKLKLTFDEYVLALRASINTPTVFLKRTCHEIMINPYNKKIFLKHRANMDIQFVLNSYGVAVYLTSYLMKSHALMNRVLRVAAVELRNNRNIPLKQKLQQIASKFQNCSEISAQECVYHLLSMPVSFSSREHTFIITFKEADRFSMLKPQKYLRIMADADTNVYMSSIQEKYVCRLNELENTCLAEFTAGYNFISNQQMKLRNKGARIPLVVEDEDELDDDEFEKLNDDIELENIDGSNANTQQTLSSQSQQQEPQQQTTTSQTSIQQPNSTNIPRNINRSSTLNVDANSANAVKIFKLRNKKGFVERREKLKIIRYRRYNVETMPDDYYREQLMLFKPWRSEKDEVEVEKPFDEFKKHSEVIALNRRKFENLLRNESEAEALERMENEVENQEDLNYAIQAAEQNRVDDILMGRQQIPIDPNLNQDEIMAELEMEREQLLERYEEEHGFHGENEQERIEPRVRVQGALTNQDSRARRRMNDDEYRHFMNRLNRRQHTFMMNCLNKIKKGETFYDLVVGESGTGKSNLIKAIDQCVERYLRKQDNSEPEKDRVILCSYTGKASFNIGGVTLHSTFRLPVKTNEMSPMSLNTCDELRKSLRKLRLIIMDEVSMIGSTLFNWVNMRLQQVFENNLPFGGVSVVLFGDFNQLHPVLDNWIFEDRVLNNQYRDLVTGSNGSLWSLFKLFRLNEIMRQAGDKRFAEALTTLGRYGLLGLNDAEVALFNQRIVDQNDIPQDAIFLYHTNENKNAMCQRRLELHAGETFRNRAKHVPKGEGNDLKAAKQYIKLHSMQKSISEKTGLANELLLKVGIQYMILINQDVSDGLVNGTTGVLRAIEAYRDHDDVDMNSNNNVCIVGELRAKFLWIEFSDENVGMKLRTKHASMYNQTNRNIPANWTPLFPQRVTFRPRPNCKWSLERIQFAIEIAEALTIDKAQGQTYPRVAFDLVQTSRTGINTLTRAHLYVAWSRVRNLGDLYLFGARSINEGKEHQSENEAKRRCEAEKKVAKNAQVVEMKRMESESAFINRFPFTDINYNHHQVRTEQVPNNGRLSICMHNVANLRFHMDSIQSDYAMMNADVLICVETATKTCESSILPYVSAGTDEYYGEYRIDDGFSLMRMGSSREEGAKIGCALYFSERALRQYNLEFVADNSPNGTGVYRGNKICELGLFTCTLRNNSTSEPTEPLFYVIYGYNHPSSKLKDFYNALKKFMTDHDLYASRTSSQGRGNQQNNNKQVYLIGDFNLDLYGVPDIQPGCQDRLIIDKLRDKLGLQFIWPSSSSSVSAAAACSNNNNKNTNNNSETWRAYDSTDRRTCIDWCMSRQHRINTRVAEASANHQQTNQLQLTSRLTVYESWFSDHKPLWLEIFIPNQQ